MAGGEKAPGAFKTIGEVSAETGVAAHILRYWESHVPALKPLRRAGGRRYFRPEDVALVRQLQSLVGDQGYTLEGAARAVNTDESFPALTPAAAAPAEPQLDRAALLAIRERLSNALKAA